LKIKGAISKERFFYEQLLLTFHSVRIGVARGGPEGLGPHQEWGNFQSFFSSVDRKKYVHEGVCFVIVNVT